MRLSRRYVVVFALAALAACGGGDLLDPRIAGQWGGDNLELQFKAEQTELHLPCSGIGILAGGVDLDNARSFSREGLMTFSPTSSFAYHVRLTGTVLGNSMVVRIINLDLENDDPAPVTLQRGQSGVFTLLCATQER